MAGTVFCNLLLWSLQYVISGNTNTRDKLTPEVNREIGKRLLKLVMV